MDFFLAGLLEVGDLYGTFSLCPREFPVLSLVLERRISLLFTETLNTI